MTYIEFVKNQINCYEIGQPIYTANIAENLAKNFGLKKQEAFFETKGIFRQIKNYKEFQTLYSYQKDIWYLAIKTPFGETGIDIERLIEDKYILPNRGYETGYSMLYRMGLTTQIPKERYIATNKATGGKEFDNQLGVVICPSKTRITKYNKLDLQFLDVLDIMDESPVDVEDPYILLAKYIQKVKLDYNHLRSIARKYYNDKTIVQLNCVARAENK